MLASFFLLAATASADQAYVAIEKRYVREFLRRNPVAARRGPRGRHSGISEDGARESRGGRHGREPAGLAARRARRPRVFRRERALLREGSAGDGRGSDQRGTLLRERRGRVTREGHG